MITQTLATSMIAACKCGNTVYDVTADLMMWLGLPFVVLTTVWLGLRQRRTPKDASDTDDPTPDRT